MAQTRKRRRRKHRGTQGGGIDRRGPRGRPRTREEAKARARQKRKVVDRRDYAPTWRSAFNRAALGAALFFVLAMVLLKQTLVGALAISVLMMGFYVPLGYYVDRYLWRRRMAKQRAAREAARANN
jgi:Flp pilus assembly protein TadB